MIRIGVLGASGRAGRLVVSCLSEHSDLQLCAALVAPDCPTRGTVCLSAIQNHQKDVLFSTDLETSVPQCDAFIDFSSPASSLQLARLCAKHKKPILVATTGHREHEINELKEISTTIPLLLAANCSLGVFALKEASLLVQRILGNDFEIEILEAHHGAKKDAPSGTALAVGGALARQNDLNQTTRGPGPRENNQLGYASIRGGDVVGDHTVFFLGRGERLEITHRATDRSIFARGAIRALRALLACNPGFYSVDQIYNLPPRS